jgi:cell fate (sporulation/competence/biofilm development) regulator YmcA (YheA/YmcA/DUF963 family)
MTKTSLPYGRRIKMADVIDPKIGEEKKEVPEVETLARSKGWKSKEELGDSIDPADYVEPHEFLRMRPLLDTMRQQRKDIKDLKKTIDAVVSFSQQNAELAAKRAVAELKKERKEAISNGDVEKVEALDTSIAQQEKIASRPPEVAPQVIEWTKNNDWFNKDPELQDFAVAWCQSYAKRNPDKPMEDALEATAKATKRAFPDNAFFKEESRREDPSPVETHKSEGGNGKKKSYTMDRLDDDQKRAYKQFMAKKVMSHDQYFKSLEEIGALGG